MDLQWFPGKADQLLTWAQEINLYRIHDFCPEGPKASTSIQVSPTKSASLLAKLSELQYPKVVDAYPGSDADGMIAVGLGNGKVVLTSFGTTIISKEFVPKTQRQINSLCWNKFTPNYLAAGFEKARSDYAVAIWDVAGSSKCVNGFHSDALRPAIELGNSETAHSVAWYQAKTLLVGMNSKHIKLFDLRDSQAKLERTAATKGVFGICIDGNQMERVASFAENQAYVWDVRNFEKPFVVLNHSKPISKIGWCPTRSGLLACLEKDSSYIELHDVHHAALSSEDGLEPAVLERRLCPAYNPAIIPFGHHAGISMSSFAWHPTEENSITTVNNNGILWNSVVFERITLNWSPISKLGWSDGKKIIRYIDHQDQVYGNLEDISVQMKQRAISGYGLQPTLKGNSKLVEDNEMLKHLWEWLQHCKVLTEKEHYRVMAISNSGIKFPGVRTILRMDGSSLSLVPSIPVKSEMVHNSSFDVHISKSYRSEERTFIQQLCGWNTNFSEMVPSSATRQAAISLFHLKLRPAIKILTESGNSIVAMAIAGFTDDRNSLWREQAQSNCGHLTDPYIRAIFSFLTETDGNFDSILNEQGMSVADRIGFACSFLPDAKLIAFIQELTNELTRKGSLYGILLTGMTPHALLLLQRYLNITGDVQTISLLAIRTMAQEIPNSVLLLFWIDRYRELLNSWKLWEARAEFDIVKNTNNPSLIPHPDVTVSCIFCGKNISQAGLTGLSRNSQLFSRFAPNSTKVKLSCCPNCRKPLPRCSICLLSMGTVLGKGLEVLEELDATSASPAALSWYTWCQTCRHGGHTIHLQRWFQKQAECPVTGCSCRCASWDKVVDFPD